MSSKPLWIGAYEESFAFSRCTVDVYVSAVQLFLFTHFVWSTDVSTFRPLYCRVYQRHNEDLAQPQPLPQPQSLCVCPWRPSKRQLRSHGPRWQSSPPRHPAQHAIRFRQPPHQPARRHGAHGKVTQAVVLVRSRDELGAGGACGLCIATPLFSTCAWCERVKLHGPCISRAMMRGR